MDLLQSGFRPFIDNITLCLHVTVEKHGLEPRLRSRSISLQHFGMVMFFLGWAMMTTRCTDPMMEVKIGVPFSHFLTPLAKHLTSERTSVATFTRLIS